MTYTQKAKVQIALLLVGAFVIGYFVWEPLKNLIPYDDTDPPDGRSGMGLYTDHKTGCQYLSVHGNGITPRLNGKGHHMGCKP